MTTVPEEAAFLEALKANPADDTVRLVYADWLDEHNEPQKAEYLRLVAALAQGQSDIERTSPQATSVCELGKTLPIEWKEAAAGRFDLVLFSFNDKVQGIKRIRRVFNLGLSCAKGVIESAPNRLAVFTPFDSVVALLDQLADNSGMTLAVCGCEHPGDPPATLFQVVAEFKPREWNYPPNPQERDPQYDKRVRASLTRFVAAALEIHQDDARERVAAMAHIPEDNCYATCFILADGVPLYEAQRLVSRYTTFLPASGFEADCYTTGRTGTNT
ncbi:TIGR02996 domain-containing protein [Gemmata sp. JC673]|uniref:TIGR02996 domain-containing protein n=1 Tax=Gemmata algarum TaxID=2975278 RepID=A0ABU5F127_9BACT|nr:TIGR02996 domain-containing protein [Gemmata algarum]MDY3561204.1 TIGR02996 domain-containing protein [Gemmata algarum]